LGRKDKRYAKKIAFYIVMLTGCTNSPAATSVVVHSTNTAESITSPASQLTTFGFTLTSACFLEKVDFFPGTPAKEVAAQNDLVNKNMKPQVFCMIMLYQPSVRIYTNDHKYFFNWGKFA
jgi:hypothetical protein